MWAISYLMLRAPTAVAPLNGAAFSGIMSWFITGIVGHPRLIVVLLASMCIVVVVVVLGRPLVQTLRMKVFLLISLSLNLALFTEIVVPFLHRPFHIYHGVM